MKGLEKAYEKMIAFKKAQKSELVDKTRKNSKTVFIMGDIKFDEDIDEKMFTMRYLRR